MSKTAKKEHQGCFCNYHCSTDDCPNIQYDMADARFGYGIADDMGLERVSCGKCGYNTFECKDCFDEGTERCPQYKGKERLVSHEQ